MPHVGGRGRRRRGRAALDSLGRAHGFARPHADLAEGTWKGVAFSLRLAYGAIGTRGTRGDARAWLVEVGAPPNRGWVIVLDALEDEQALAQRLPQLCDAAVTAWRAIAG